MRIGSRSWLALAVSGGWMWGCSALVDTSDLASDAIDAGDGMANVEGGSGADASDATTHVDAGSDVDTKAGPCPSGRGPAMVEVKTLIGQRFCIDATETTESQYETFLFERKGDAGAGPTGCEGNGSIVPTCNYAPTENPNLPVTCVDWCDAWSYCSWAGKRLCGSIDRVTDAGGTPETNEWIAACTANGSRAYPYGSGFIPKACNLEDENSGPIAVGTKPACQGGVPGLFDMTGNVNEWTDSCDSPNANGACQARGGDYESPVGTEPFVDETRCVTADVYHPPRNFGDGFIGIRCCSNVID